MTLTAVLHRVARRNAARLVMAVAGLSPKAVAAMADAAASGTLRRYAWHSCPIGVAAASLRPVTGR